MVNNFEQIFLSYLGPDSEKLKWELNNNIDLVNYWEQTSAQTFFAVILLLAFVPKKAKEEMFKDITSERIIDLLRRERQDLYKIIITHPNGRVWVKNQTENFKKRFL